MEIDKLFKEKITLVAFEIKDKNTVEIEFKLGSVKAVFKGPMTCKEFCRVMPEFSGARFETVKKVTAGKLPLIKKKYVRKKRLEEVEKVAAKRKVVKKDESKRRAGETKAKKENRFDIATILSVGSKRRKTKTEVYYKVKKNKTRYYVRSLTSKKGRPNSINAENYKKIMDKVGAITEPESYNVLQATLSQELGISSNRFYVWFCVARALEHIEATYDSEKKITMIKPTGKHNQEVELLG